MGPTARPRGAHGRGERTRQTGVHLRQLAKKSTVRYLFLFCLACFILLHVFVFLLNQGEFKNTTKTF
jgi:hypothetical protein